MSLNYFPGVILFLVAAGASLLIYYPFPEVILFGSINYYVYLFFHYFSLASTAQVCAG